MSTYVQDQHNVLKCWTRLYENAIALRGKIDSLYNFQRDLTESESEIYYSVLAPPQSHTCHRKSWEINFTHGHWKTHIRVHLSSSKKIHEHNFLQVKTNYKHCIKLHQIIWQWLSIHNTPQKYNLYHEVPKRDFTIKTPQGKSDSLCS